MAKEKVPEDQDAEKKLAEAIEALKIAKIENEKLRKIVAVPVQKIDGAVYLRVTKHGNPSGVDKKYVNEAKVALVEQLKAEGWLPEAEFNQVKA